jgi:hypothetical protein
VFRGPEVASSKEFLASLTTLFEELGLEPSNRNKSEVTSREAVIDKYILL